MSYYAIGIGEYVELREGTKAPVKNITEADRGSYKERVCVGHVTDSDGYPRPKYKIVDVPVKIKMVTFEGGKVICALALRNFASLTGILVAPDTVATITKAQAKKVMDFKGV